MNREHRRSALFKRKNRTETYSEPSQVLTPFIRCTTFSQNEAATLSVQVRMAWHKLSNGEGSIEAFDCLAGHLNAAYHRANEIHADCAAIIDAAQASANVIRDRYERTKVFGADAHSLRVIPEALDLYDQILANSSPAQMVAAAKL
jgi:hypothetical protein